MKQPVLLVSILALVGCDRASHLTQMPAPHDVHDPAATLDQLDAGAPSLPPAEADAGDMADGDAGATDASAGARTATSSYAIITRKHRFVPGAMFGGWGPHLGHLMRTADGTLSFVDDACDQAGGALPCNVDVDYRVDYHQLIAGRWTRKAMHALPSVIQENMGTIVRGNRFLSYGLDITTREIWECSMNSTNWAGSCGTISSDPLPPFTNYIGAAITPSGYPMVWATTVGDGGGGSFSWFVNYGQGWNGPRIGAVGGYNDASYVNIAFGIGAHADRFTMHAQLVSGLAPNWNFIGAVGDGDASSSNAVTFSTFGPAGTDPLISTDDVVIDPVTGDTHLLARTMSDSVAYAHRSVGHGFAAPIVVIPAAFRARIIALADGTLVVVYGKNRVGLMYRVFRPERRMPNQPLDFANTEEVPVPLPAGYETIYAIYPEASVYQRALPTSVNVALVGDVRQNEVLHVAIDP